MINKLYLSVIIVFIPLIGCQSTLNIKEHLNKADTIEISFYNPKKNNKKLVVMTINRQDHIKEVLKFISTESAPFYRCSYHGSIAFFKHKQRIIYMQFNLLPSCPHIVFSYKKKHYSRKLTQGGLNFLRNHYYPLLKKNILKTLF